MARAPKAKTLAHAAVTRTGGTYQIQIEDEAGKKALFELTSDQAVGLADRLDDLLADEEDEQRAAAPAPAAPRTGSRAGSSEEAQEDSREPPPEGAREEAGTVKWYNATKGFGFITPDSGGEEVFLHRSVLEHAGLSALPEGMRVRITVVDGKKGPQVNRIEPA